MSGEKSAGSCAKFQANIFNKTKCQNCFKSRELHPLTDRDLEQAKPVYGGWLCLAPEGTDFENPVQRSRKWQRRFFVLYEHGSLRFALDELPSTLPQGTVNLNLCTDIADAEPRTGQRNALRIATSQQEIFIRGDNKEVINGWSEQLSVYLRTNRRSLRWNPGVERPTTQIVDSGATSGCSVEEHQRGGPPPAGPETPSGSTDASPPLADSSLVPAGSLDTGVHDGCPNPGPVPRSEEVLLGDGSISNGWDAPRTAPEEGGAPSRKGRSEASSHQRERLRPRVDEAGPGAPRRAKSLDGRTSDTIMTPDLLNFKKGWMVRLEEDGQWRKYWFVLSADSLRFFKDSAAEEASDLEGEIDLTRCYAVSEYQVQRNYGFQIQTANGVHTLSAMTAGIRKNWIQALMKNVIPSKTPDVTSFPPHRPGSPPHPLLKPDLTRGSASPELPADGDRPKGVTERRREGRYKTFDWTEFRPRSEPADVRTPEAGDLEKRRKRREERRKRYESMLGLPAGQGVAGATRPEPRQKLEEEIEACWRQVEEIVFRQEKMVPLRRNPKCQEETEKLLDGYKRQVEDLTAQLADSERRRLELEAFFLLAGDHLHHHRHLEQQSDASTSSEGDVTEMQTLTEDLGDSGELFPPPPETPSVWLHDTEGNSPEVGDQPSDWPETAASLLPLRRAEEPSGPKTDHQTHPGEKQSPSPETRIADGLLLLEELGEGGVCVEKHVPPDGTVTRGISRELELVTVQNRALNQRNQEMLNQLVEADREIERLRAELGGRLAEEEPASVEDLQRELNSREQQLLEAKALISSLEESLRDAESRLEKAVPTKTGEEEGKKSEGYLLRCFEATEAKLRELERQLSRSEKSCEELREQKSKLTEEAAGMEENIARLSREVDFLKSHDGSSLTSGEERIKDVIESMAVRLKVLGRLLEVVERLDVSLIVGSEQREEDLTMARQLRWEEEIWNAVLSGVKSNPGWLEESEPEENLVAELAEQMMVEKQILLFGHNELQWGRLGGGPKGMFESGIREDQDASVEETKEAGESRKCDGSPLIPEMVQGVVRHFRATVQSETSCLNAVASSSSSSVRDALQLLAVRLVRLKEPQSGWIHSAAAEAKFCFHLCRLQAAFREEPGGTGPSSCTSCALLVEENRELRARLARLEGYQEPLEVLHEEILDSGNEDDLRVQAGVGTGLKDQTDEKVTSIQLQHEEELELLKRRRASSAVLQAACQAGFASMEESHLKEVEELRRQHRREVERLLAERDHLLEEETAATATAIQAIQRAHLLALEEEQQRRWLLENSTGNNLLEEVFSQHRRELASAQRELQVLSHQFSLKCLENGQLVQALDAERKALCQCQQENQDLQNRNQGLSAHLAAEITRLCSLANPDAAGLSGCGVGVYEMEITPRAKESEVQSLKQEITSLKEELQAAQRDKRLATKKHKDMCGELSAIRVRTQRETDELRENLRLANRALSLLGP